MSTQRVEEASASRRWVPQFTFGDHVRKIRRELGLSQEEFAQPLGVTKVTYGAWETGRNRPGNIVAVAKRIELSYGVPASWTLGVNDEDRHPDHPNGGSCSVCAPRDLNPEPTD